MEIKDLEEISNSLLTIYNEKIKTILDTISIDYNINNTELYDKFLKKKIKPKLKNIQLDNYICMARKQDGNQCTRKKKFGEFCGKHETNQKFGRIDDYNNLIDKLSQDDNYIMTWVETINDKEYLVDSNNVVYTNNLNNPQIIGKKINNLIEFINKSE
uniref:Uncharacterized protein n=1 Tax=viral metagenome TaxID=1070528 RepID=A0A6C0EJ86_9ZZZZ